MSGQSRQVVESQRTIRTPFGHVFEEAPFCIYVVDARLRIVLANAVSKRGLFRKLHPVVGCDLSEAMHALWPKSVGDKIVSLFRRTLRTGKPYRSNVFISRRQDIDIAASYQLELRRLMKLARGRFGVVCYCSDSSQSSTAPDVARQGLNRGQVTRQFGVVKSCSQDQ